MFRGWLKYASISAPLDALAYGLAVLLRESALAEYYYGYLGAEAIGIFIIFLIRYLFVSKYIWKVHSAVS
jgi:putative flippase GtrA